MILGYNMAGNEKAFFVAIDKTYCEPFVYFEIGVAKGETIYAVDEYLKDKERTLIGIDLPGCKVEHSENIFIKAIGSDAFFSDCSLRANFIFIDACHGYECVTKDFLNAEKHIKEGGIICFHDADEECQNTHWHQHCGRGIEVRRALKDLDLLDNQRAGWNKVKETTGDKSKAGHGCSFFQKI